MSARSSFFPRPQPSPDVLGDLLHSLSQPLTSLRCFLELSLAINEISSAPIVAPASFRLPSACVVAGLRPAQTGQSPVTTRARVAAGTAAPIGAAQQETVLLALQQAESAIGMVRLMREYLDAEHSDEDGSPVSLEPVVSSISEELSSVAMVRDIKLRLIGSCTATLPIPESRLRLALQYLITALIEAQPNGGRATLLLGEGPAGTVLRAEGDGDIPRRNSVDYNHGGLPALRTARLAIASRVLESAGASLVFTRRVSEFVLRIPREIIPPAQLLRHSENPDAGHCARCE
jgi:signal transduction histidine kinase